MPKVVLGRYAAENEELRRIITGGMERQGKSRREMCAKTRVCEKTYYNRLKKPGKITVDEIREYRRELKISDADLLSIL